VNAAKKKERVMFRWVLVVAAVVALAAAPQAWADLDSTQDENATAAGFSASYPVPDGSTCNTHERYSLQKNGGITFSGSTVCSIFLTLSGHAWISFEGTTYVDGNYASCVSCDQVLSAGSSLTLHTGWTYTYNYSTTLTIPSASNLRWATWPSPTCGLIAPKTLKCLFQSRFNAL
jgi:hypothetical protein